MSVEDEPKKAKTGYRNPPQSGRFQKGVSGNPRGRPRKRRDEPALPDHRAPTVQEVIWSEFDRNIPITDDSGRHTITMKHAVVRAMAATAIKRGVLAQRSFLELTATEEERYRKEKEKSYKFWRDYKEAAEARIAAGEPRPDDQPDPDYIKLDWRSGDVRIEGPIDREDRAAARIVCAVRDTAYLMVIYHDEPLNMCDADGRVSQMGAYFGFYLMCQHVVWPRMRRRPQAYDKIINRGISLGWDTCEKKLKARCKAVGLPFLPRKKNASSLMVPLAKLGIKKPIQLWPIVVPPRPRRRRGESFAKKLLALPRQRLCSTDDTAAR